MFKRFIGSSESARALSSAGSATFAINLFGTAIGFGLQVLLARVLGAEEYGAYSYVVAWLTVLVLFASLGFDSSLVRFVASYRNKNELGLLAGLLRTSFISTLVCSLLIGSVVAVVVSLFWYRIDSRLVTPFLLGAILLPIWALFTICIGVLQGMKLYFWARVPQFIIRPFFMCLVVGTAFLLGKELSARAAMGIHISALLLALTLCALKLSRSIGPQLRNVVPVAERGIWFNATLGLMLVGALQSLASQIDTILLGTLLPLREVGLYSVAAKISTLTLFGMQAINVVAAPMIAETYSAHEADSKVRKESLQELASRIARWIAVFSIPLTLAVVIFGNSVLAAFGIDYVSAYSALLCLTLGQLINVSAGPVGFMLTMTGNERTSIYLLVVAILTNILLIYPLTLFFGLSGAALATGISIALRNILAWVYVKRILDVDPSLYPIFRRLIRRISTKSSENVTK